MIGDKNNAKAGMYPISSICRLRINSDGEGVRTLILLSGCPLRCKYCINPFTWNGSRKSKYLSAEELYSMIGSDRLYLLATNGGVTFGGGEPLLYPHLIEEFRKILDGELTIYVETSLHVSWKNVEQIIPFVDRYYIDIKTLSSSLYYDYTGGNLELVISNLKRMITTVDADKIIVRIPEISGLVGNEQQLNERELLLQMGVKKFDLFKYRLQ